MSQIIKIKHSTTTGNKPTSLSAGELALNVSDGNFFFGDGSNVQNYLHLGTTSASTLSITKTLVVTGQTETYDNVTIGGDLYVNRIRRQSDSSTTTKILLNDEVLKFYGGHSSNPLVQMANPNMISYKPFNVSGQTSLGGNVLMDMYRITGMGDPTAAQDAATKSYVDSSQPAIGHYLPLSGGTVTGVLNVSGNTTVRGVFRTLSGLRLGSGVLAGDGIINFGPTGNKNYPQIRQTEVNQLLLDRGNDENLVTYNFNQHVDGPAVKITGDIDLEDGRKLYLDGGTDTYLTTGGVNNTIGLYVNDVNIVNFKEPGTLIATPLNVSGATDIDGTLNVNANLITNVTNPTSAQDAATKAYVDQYATSGVSSVAISGSDGIDVDSGSPITSSGTIALGLSSVPNSSLANSSVNYGGVSLSLGGSDTTPAFDLRDATGYRGTSTLVTTGTITSGVWNTNRLFTAQTAEGAWMGDYVTFGEEAVTTPGALYYFDGATWVMADSSAASSSTGLLAIALNDTNLEGMLIRGMYGLLPVDPGSAGDVLYISESAGRLTNTAPTTSAAIVRVVGYAITDTPNIWFNPDNTWVELS